MSLAEIKDAVETLSPGELASFIRQRENADWDHQIDADFAEGWRLQPLLEEIREDMQHAGIMAELREARQAFAQNSVWFCANFTAGATETLSVAREAGHPRLIAHSTPP